MKRWMCIGVMLVAVVVLLPGVGMAAGPPEARLLERFAALDAKVAALEAQVKALEQQLLAQANSPVMALNPYLSVDPAHHRVRFTGVNLQLVNGTGRTDTVNGRGNLILGYDLARDDDTYFCADGYQQVPACVSCHTEFATEWQHGPHGQAASDPAFVEDWTKQGQPGACLVCHVTNYDPATGAWQQDGVACEACHGAMVEDHPKEPMPVDRESDL